MIFRQLFYEAWPSTSLLPICLQPVYLQCHGPVRCIAPEVKALLQHHYPPIG